MLRDTVDALLEASTLIEFGKPGKLTLKELSVGKPGVYTRWAGETQLGGAVLFPVVHVIAVFNVMTNSDPYAGAEDAVDLVRTILAESPDIISNRTPAQLVEGLKLTEGGRDMVAVLIPVIGTGPAA